MSLTRLSYLALIFPVWFSSGFYCVLAFMHSALPPVLESVSGSSLQTLRRYPSFSSSLCLSGILGRWVWAFMRFFFFFFHLNLIASKQNHQGFTVECSLVNRSPGPSVSWEVSELSFSHCFPAVGVHFPQKVPSGLAVTLAVTHNHASCLFLFPFFFFSMTEFHYVALDSLEFTL